jgi:hypothetical protein
VGFRFLSLAAFSSAGRSTSRAVPAFRPKNSFYGGQLGLKTGGRWGRFSADLMGKVAFGSTHEASAFTAAATASSGRTGGFVGRKTRDEFGILPQVQLQAGYDLTSSARLFIGYDFLYLNEVLRASEQTFPSRGLAPFQGGDFWAQA